MSTSRPIREIDTLSALLRQGGNLDHAVIQGLDLRGLDWSEVSCQKTVFLGCQLPASLDCTVLQREGAVSFPEFEGLPYHPYRGSLYDRDELMEGWAPAQDDSLDWRIYQHFSRHGRSAPALMESLAMRLHDHAIDDALSDLLEGRTDSCGKKKVVGIMGGHSTPRTDPYFQKVALLARQLTAQGYFIATGGGPGIMEAGNLGAYFADYEEEDLKNALEILCTAPSYKDSQYVAKALEVVEKYPRGAASLAVPTWFYGHEPSNLFSAHIAKYFSNSLREDGLLAIATYGIVFAPGSAGTCQEVFMDATQNHYKTFEHVSPMIFLGKEHYGEKTLIYDCLRKQAKGHPYEEYLAITDEIEEAASFLIAHPPLA